MSAAQGAEGLPLEEVEDFLLKEQLPIGSHCGACGFLWICRDLYRFMFGYVVLFDLGVSGVPLHFPNMLPIGPLRGSVLDCPGQTYQSGGLRAGAHYECCSGCRGPAA